MEYTREVDGKTLHLFRFIHRNAMVEGPDEEPKGKPYVDKIWAENYEEAAQEAVRIMDRIVVAVYPAREEERLTEVLERV